MLIQFTSVANSLKYVGPVIPFDSVGISKKVFVRNDEMDKI